jgi:hypothetical protein
MTHVSNTSEPAAEKTAEAEATPASHNTGLLVEWFGAIDDGATFGQAFARVFGGAQPGKESRWINTVAAFFLLGLGIGLQLFMFSR